MHRPMDRQKSTCHELPRLTERTVYTTREDGDEKDGMV
jgi:hypothetical protein